MARSKTGRSCRRILRDPESVRRGFGPVCFEKRPVEVTRRLEEAGQLRLPGI